jgi:hypothetical protein
VTLYWQALAHISEDYEVFIQIINDNGDVVGATHDFPYNGMYRSRIWNTDELTATHHWLKLSDTLPVGRYTLRAGLYRMLHNEPLTTEGASANTDNNAILSPNLRVSAPPASLDIATIDTDIRFDDLFQLSGIDITSDAQQFAYGDTWNVSAGQTLDITFAWSVLQRPQRDYSLFLHVTRPDDPAPIAQADISLGAQTYPSGAWRIGDTQHDNMQLTLPDDLTAASYDVWVGVYYYADNTRLTPIVDGEAQADGRLLLGQLNLE